MRDPDQPTILDIPKFLLLQWLRTDGRTECCVTNNRDVPTLDISSLRDILRLALTSTSQTEVKSKEPSSRILETIPGLKSDNNYNVMQIHLDES